ncbi:hypothetical protein [Clostridium sp. BNL1100]|uniref:hypothetical protein n=1 Tax=Clostridium sp. BNL1100 TaxID=755731 RepID=UPI00024A71B3|nr:hypothetical protein [Clostridium sp. BNL1100]AEY67195.1 hypothetical protein Clo1100_3047 [Clostridium sp. BNL1100]
MSHSTIGFAFEDLGEKEMAASQNASSSANSIVTIYSLTGTCLPSIVTICVTVPVTITAGAK